MTSPVLPHDHAARSSFYPHVLQHSPAFETDCVLEPFGQEKTPKTLKLSKDAEFEVYLALDNP